MGDKWRRGAISASLMALFWGFMDPAFLSVILQRKTESSEVSATPIVSYHIPTQILRVSKDYRLKYQ